MNSNISNLEKKIGINFKNKKLLLRSLTHKSYNISDNNEKLEFLGDRVLGLIISKTLFEIFPNDTEGMLDKKLASLVNKKQCFQVSKIFNLQNYINIGNKKIKNNKIEDKILSDSCEALIGAIYLDQGMKITEDFIIKFWKKYLNTNTKYQIDSKTKLQEYSLKKFKILPKYKLLSNTGPRHDPLFKIGVSVNNSSYIYAKGKSKKETEQKAATLLLKKIGIK